MASLVLFMVATLVCGSSRGARQVGPALTLLVPAVPGNDIVKDAVEHLVRGANISEGKIKDLRAAIEKANEAMGETENTLQQGPLTNDVCKQHFGISTPTPSNLPKKTSLLI